MSQVEAVTLTSGPAPASYAARAFRLQYNLILLGGSALFALAAASLVPLWWGLGAELGWLVIGSNLGPVRRWLDRREVFAEQTETEPPPVSVPPVSVPLLDREYAARLNIVDQALGELRALVSRQADPAFVRAVPRLGALHAAFQAACVERQGVARFLVATPESALKQEVEQLQANIAGELDLAAKLMLRQALVLAKRRVEQREGMVAELGNLALRLDTIERAVAGLLTQGRALGPTARLATEIDATVAELGKRDANVASPGGAAQALSDPGAARRASRDAASSRRHTGR